MIWSTALLFIASVSLSLPVELSCTPLTVTGGKSTSEVFQAKKTAGTEPFLILGPECKQ